MQYNRKLASICLICIIALALAFGTLRSVSALASDVERIYQNGSEQYGTLRTDIARLTSQANELLSLFAAVIGSNGDSIALNNAISTLSGNLDHPCSAAFAQALADLRTYAAAVYYKLDIEESIQNTQQHTTAIAYYRELQSTLMRISNNQEYTTVAQKYNAAIQSPPGSVAAGFLSLENAPVLK